MAMRLKRFLSFGAFVVTACAASAPVSAALFWVPPDFSGERVKGDEPGLGTPLPGATAKELQAHLIWNMRAGLNVAALQCQFAPALMTVRNYNDLLLQHAAELNGAYTTLNAYFKRTGGKAWQNLFDQYTTRTYNGFSTLHAQLGFCETAASIGREAIERRKGALYITAETRMREFRNSLVPQGDRLFGRVSYLNARQLPSLDQQCWTKNDLLLKRCALPETSGVASTPPTNPNAS